MRSMSCQPFTVARFVVRPCDPEPRQFLSEPEATRAAVRAARRFGASDVYKVLGEPVTNLWRRPVLVASYER